MLRSKLAIIKLLAFITYTFVCISSDPSTTTLSLNFFWFNIAHRIVVCAWRGGYLFIYTHSQVAYTQVSVDGEC